MPTPSMMRGLTAETTPIAAAASLPAVERPVAATPAPVWMMPRVLSSLLSGSAAE